MALPKNAEKKVAKLTSVKTPKAEVKAAPAKVAEKKETKEAKAPREIGARSELYEKKIVHVAPIEEARRVPGEGTEPTATFLRYKLYKVGQTVKDFLEKGGKMVDVNWDVKHGFVKLGS